MTAEQLKAVLFQYNTIPVKVNVPGRGYYDLSNDVIIQLKSQGYKENEIILKAE